MIDWQQELLDPGSSWPAREDRLMDRDEVFVFTQGQGHHDALGGHTDRLNARSAPRWATAASARGWSAVPSTPGGVGRDTVEIVEGGGVRTEP